MVFPKRQLGCGSVLVWGAIGFEKVGPLQFISKRITNLGYEMSGLDWKLQQDNASIHKLL